MLPTNQMFATPLKTTSIPTSTSNSLVDYRYDGNSKTWYLFIRTFHSDCHQSQVYDYLDPDYAIDNLTKAESDVVIPQPNQGQGSSFHNNLNMAKFQFATKTLEEVKSNIKKAYSTLMSLLHKRLSTRILNDITPIIETPGSTNQTRFHNICKYLQSKFAPRSANDAHKKFIFIFIIMFIIY